jgi:hypothetical protein
MAHLFGRQGFALSILQPFIGYLVTVRTSQTVWRSAESFDDFSHERERDRFDEFAFVSDINPPAGSGQCSDNVLMFELPADEAFGVVELDAATSSDLTDPGGQATGDGQGRQALAVKVEIEGEALGQVTEGRPIASPVPGTRRPPGTSPSGNRLPAGSRVRAGPFRSTGPWGG